MMIYADINVILTCNSVLYCMYHLVMTNIAMERSTIFKFGKPSIKGPFSMGMLNNQRVTMVKKQQTLF